MPFDTDLPAHLDQLTLQQILAAIHHNPVLGAELLRHLRETPLSEDVPPPETLTFLYPTVNVYAFDPVARALVLALRDRAWQAPGVDVTFETYGHDHEQYRMVKEIRTRDVRIRFHRPQGPVPARKRPTNWAGVYEITCRLGRLAVFGDGSGPSFDYFVSGDWEKNRAHLLTGNLALAKLYRQERRYVPYVRSSRSTDTSNPSDKPNEGAPFLIPGTDYRDYAADAHDPASISLTELEIAMAAAVQMVLDEVLASPLP